MKKLILPALTTALILGAASSPSFAMELGDGFTLDAEGRYYFLHTDIAKSKDHHSILEARLSPTYEFNENWTLKSRLVGYWDIDDGDADFDSGLSYVYVETNFNEYQARAGRVQLVSQADRNPNSGSMVFDGAFKGVQVSTDMETSQGSDLKFIVNAGKYHDPTYIAAEALYDSNENLTAGIGYHYLKKGSAKANILTLGAGYDVNEDWGVYGAYAHNSKSSFQKNAYNIEATYLGADKDVKNSWGAFAAYRYLGAGTTFSEENEIFGVARGFKGIDFGGTWTPINDATVKLSYFDGKGISNSSVKAKIFYARASVFF